MNISVIIPVYNERDTIAEILRRVRDVPLPKEIVCVDDGSTDGTRDILERERRNGTLVLLHPHNLGKGAAVRTGLGQAKGDIVIIQDADLEYNPQDYPALLQPILDGQAKVVYGSRFLGRPENMRLTHNWGNRLVTAAANLLFGTRLTDVETCYKVLAREVASRIELESARWGFDPEITARILKMGYRIHEVPISYRGRMEGKKLRWRDGFSVIMTLLKYRFFD